MTRTTLTIVPPRHRDDILPPLDASQERIVDKAQHGSIIFRGAPGSGKTATLLAVVAQCVSRGQSFVFLAPDRQRVRRLHAQVQALAPDVSRPVKTAAAFAYSVIDAWRNFRADPLGGVELMTGAQEDSLLEELLSSHPVEELSSFLADDGVPSGALRMELRNVLSTAQRFGITSLDLEALSEQYGFAPWLGASAILRRIEDRPEFTPSVRGTMKVTHAAVEGIAAQIISQWEEEAPQQQVTVGIPLPDVLIVDDAQDMTPSTMHLLETATSFGARIVVASEPDTCVATFRGAFPHNDILLSQALDLPIEELSEIHIGTAQIRSMVERINSFTGTAGPAKRRRSSLHPSPDNVKAEISLRAGYTHAQMGAQIARILRENYLFAHVPWNEQAVIVRSQGVADRLATHLRRAGIPIDQRERAFQFMSEPVTRILLTLIHHAQNDGTSDSETVLEELLASSLVRCDPVDLHRLLRAYGFIMYTEGTLPGGTSASIGELFARIQSWSDQSPKLSDQHMIEEEIHAHPALAVYRDLLTQLSVANRIWQEMYDGAHDRPRTALWKMWNAAGVAEKWQHYAVSSGQSGRWYDDQLDAVVALFRVADIWEQRNPTGTAGEFAADLISHNIPIDTLAQSAIRESAVSVLTPTQAAREHWDVVVIAGVHDGEWPNLSLRNQMLQADILARIAVDTRLGADDLSWAELTDTRIRRQQIKEDEYRLFVSALSRARRQVHFAIVMNDDAAPSELLSRALGTTEGNRIEEGIPRDEEGRVVFAVTPAPTPLNEGGVVGDLRYWATSPEETPEKEIAQTALALLSREGIRGAHPHEWLVPGPLTSDEPILGGQKPAISPSGVEAIETCPLRWFARQVGAESRSGASATRGTFIHSIAEAHQKNPQVSVIDLFLEGWPAYSEDLDAVEARKERQKIEQCLEGLQDYFDSLDPQTRDGAEVERFLSHDMGEYVIRGMIDRLEPRGNKWRIVDFKTGNPKKPEDALVDPQLYTYQLLATEEGYDIEGAQLQYVAVRATRNKPAHVAGERFQPALSAEELEQHRERLLADAKIMNASVFEARINPACAYCSFKPICPAYMGTGGDGE